MISIAELALIWLWLSSAVPACLACLASLSLILSVPFGFAGVWLLPFAFLCVHSFFFLFLTAMCLIVHCSGHCSIVSVCRVLSFFPSFLVFFFFFFSLPFLQMSLAFWLTFFCRAGAGLTFLVITRHWNFCFLLFLSDKMCTDKTFLFFCCCWCCRDANKIKQILFLKFK